MGISPGKNLEIDSYMGFKQPFDKTLGYEVGLIRYSYPEVTSPDSQELFGGLTLLGSRFGIAFSNDPDKQNNTCLLYTSPSPRDRQKSRMPSSA